jgi:hypothetical protein
MGSDFSNIFGKDVVYECQPEFMRINGDGLLPFVFAISDGPEYHSTENRQSATSVYAEQCKISARMRLSSDNWRWR